MTTERPPLVGFYHLLEDFETQTASVRVFRLKASEEEIEPHLHRRSMQIYVAIEGEVIISVDGSDTVLRPYQAMSVWAGSVHSARPNGEDAVLMNISMPPLAPDDQLGAEAQITETASMRMPGPGSDVDD